MIKHMLIFNFQKIMKNNQLNINYSLFLHFINKINNLKNFILKILMKFQKFIPINKNLI